MSRSEYERYLFSEAWRRKRHDALVIWHWACALNAKHTTRLEVHHRTYARLGHEDLEDLIVLCSECHRRFHGQLPHLFSNVARPQLDLQPLLPFVPVIPEGPELN